jgi:hypothetical protein
MTGERVHVLVDVTNVARSSEALATWTDVADEVRIRRCYDATLSWAAMEGHDVLAALDGGAVTADRQIIDAAAAARSAGRRWWLVSDDRALRDVAGVGAERMIATAAFVSDLAGISESSDDALADFERPTGIGSQIDPETIVRLERIRRGESE